MSDHITPSRLKSERGWTDALIKRFLGEPDDTATNPHYRSGPLMKLYKLERVEKVEATPEWQAARTGKARVRKSLKTAAGRKREELLAWAENVPIIVRRMPMERVMSESLAARKAWHDYQRDLRGRWDDTFTGEDADESTRERWAVNYLRHEHTHYDSTLMDAYGKVGVDDAADRIKERVLEKIAEVYPELGPACEQQLQRMLEKDEMREANRALLGR